MKIKQAPKPLLEAPRTRLEARSKRILDKQPDTEPHSGSPTNSQTLSLSFPTHIVRGFHPSLRGQRSPASSAASPFRSSPHAKAHAWSGYSKQLEPPENPSSPGPQAAKEASSFCFANPQFPYWDHVVLRSEAAG